MTLREFIIWMFIGTLVCWAAFGLIIYNSNPFETSMIVFVFFYASLGLAMTGTLTVAGVFVRLSILRREGYLARRVVTSFRQGAFLSSALVLSLLLMSRGLLTWWNILLFVASISLLEFFFISSKRAGR